MVLYPPIGSTTPLPLCGEWIVVQMNPTAMVKHLDHPNAPKLVQEFLTLPLHTYVAVFRRYLEAPSDRKPWHMCELYLMHSLESAEDQKEENAPKESIVPASEAERKDKLFPPRSKKKHYIFQTIYARLRTRHCELPRDAPQLVHEDVWPQMRDHLMMRSEELRKFPVEVRKAFLERLPDPECQPDSIAGEDAAKHPWDVAHRPGICLVPHFDYSFDIRMNISPGIFWENEHNYVVKKLLEFVPSMPRVVRIPVRPVEFQDRQFFVEHEKNPNIARDVFGEPYNDNFPAPPQGKRDRVFGALSELGRLIRPDKPRPGVLRIERTYRMQVEKPTDAIWVRVPAIVRIHFDNDGVPAKEGDDIKVVPPVRRQSIVLVDKSRTPGGVAYIDHQFYVPFVDEVALDIDVMEGLESKASRRFQHL